MGGRSYRVPDVVTKTWWTVKVDGFGEHQIVDQDGKDPLRSPMPLERLQGRYLAAAAPMLRYALSRATAELAKGDPEARTREGAIVGWLWDVMHCSKPLVSDELAAIPAQDQLRLYLEAAA